MTEHPIIFVGESVRGAYAGIKTQTRRVWPDHKLPQGHILKMLDNGHTFVNRSGSGPVDQFCPYGKPGDTLWVRECWWKPPPQDSDIPIQYDANLTPDDRRNAERDLLPIGWKRTSSIHMHKWACRLRLTLIDVRAQRLQDISPEDAIAEGIIVYAHGPLAPLYDYPGHDERANIGYDCPVKAYAAWWDVLNPKRGYPWSGNFWVWCLSFEVQNGTN